MTAPLRTAIALDAERAVLGACLLDSACIATLTSLSPDDFAGPGLAAVAKTLLTLAGRGAPIDLVSVTAEMRPANVGATAAMVSALMATVPSAANVAHHLGLVREAATRRRLAAAGAAISAAAREAESAGEAVEAAEKALAAVGRSGGGAGALPLAPLLSDAYVEIERRAAEKRRITGVPTGLIGVDHVTAGLQPSTLVILAGRPGQGKTACALGWLAAAAKAGVPGVLFSLEMSSQELVMRLLASEARVDGARLKTGILTNEDWCGLSRACGALSGLPIHLDDSGSITLAEIRARCRKLATNGGLGLVFVDYIQLVRASDKARSREQEVAELSRGLKALAKELRCPVVALSSLNRGLENRPDKRPHLADLRESGSIEADADTVLFVYRHETYFPDSDQKDIAELIIGKHRAGACATIRTRFSANLTKFENLEESDAPHR